MSSLRDVQDDLLKDWLYFRDENFCSLVNADDRKHMIKFDEISDIILKSIQSRTDLLFKNNWINLMIMLWIILVIGMKNILEMVFVMALNLSLEVQNNKV